MSGNKDSGDKTEKPTPKRLEDARKKGDVAKSKEITSTVELMIWLALGGLLSTYAAERISALMTSALAAVSSHADSAVLFRNVSYMAIETLALLTAVLLIPVVAVGLLTEFLQIGPVVTAEKFKPKMENMNPVEGVKRMFTMDNVIEVLKAVGKTALLCLIGWLVIKAALPELILLVGAPAQIGNAIWTVSKQTLVWTLVIFALVSVLDMSWQKFSFTKKMRMSMRDIKQEMKESEGDPYIKAQRKQTHQEWSQRNAAAAAGGANVLVVNPTHVAIAIDYDKQTCPVPTISAKGEDLVARAMREAAEDAGVPIVRNITLARDLLARGEIGEIIPRDLFDIIAEVILWAREVREEMDADPSDVAAADKAGTSSGSGKARHAAPGEDLTRRPHLH
jgi:type III secretion protein U